MKSTSFEIPIIVVGNLTLGGTGKTPHTIYIAKILSKFLNIGVLSRGYGRKSKGFIEIESNFRSSISGDEPLLIKNNLPNSYVSVCENRVNGINKMLESPHRLDAIILDDALQHRPLKAGFNILLIDYNLVKQNKLLLPAGNLRDNWNRRLYSDLVIVSKCPMYFNKKNIENKLKLKPSQHVFYSRYQYINLISFNEKTKESLDYLKNKNIVLITGIASPTYLLNFLNKYSESIQHYSFKDHHKFKLEEIKKIKCSANALNKNTLFISTEKDAVKISELLSESEKNEWFYIKIDVMINNSVLFEKIILEYVRKNSRNS